MTAMPEEGTTRYSENKLGEIQTRLDVARLHIPEEGCWKTKAESWAEDDNSQRENICGVGTVGWALASVLFCYNSSYGDSSGDFT